MNNITFKQFVAVFVISTIIVVGQLLNLHRSLYKVIDRLLMLFYHRRSIYSNTKIVYKRKEVTILLARICQEVKCDHIGLWVAFNYKGNSYTALVSEYAAIDGLKALRMYDKKIPLTEDKRLLIEASKGKPFVHTMSQEFIDKMYMASSLFVDPPLIIPYIHSQGCTFALSCSYFRNQPNMDNIDLEQLEKLTSKIHYLLVKNKHI